MDYQFGNTFGKVVQRETFGTFGKVVQRETKNDSFYCFQETWRLLGPLPPTRYLQLGEEKQGKFILVPIKSPLLGVGDPRKRDEI